MTLNRFSKRPGYHRKQGLLGRMFLLLSMAVFAVGLSKAALAMGTSGGGQQGGGGLAAFLPLILIVVVFYFLLIRPQTKRQKEHKMLLANLHKGDKVVTSSGIFGTIVGMDEKENKVVLKVAENVKVEFLKSSIAGKVGTEE